MRFYLLFIIFLLSAFLNLESQKVQYYELSADGRIIFSEVTDTSKTYIITVEGTYSMWPRKGSTECYGVDAAYIYDVPKEEIDNWRWPPQSLLPLPVWVGSTQEINIPPASIGVPIYKLSFRRYTGFRINDEPLPNTGINMINHTYTIEKKGTGEPFKFQILDSNYNILLEKVVPRYEDNCGFLKITIQEKVKNQPIVDICNIEGICDNNNALVGLRVWSKIFVEDPNNPTGSKNELKNILPSQISVIENGIFKCDVQINCNSTQGMSTGLLVDVSPSMDLNIRPGDITRRIDATKSALKKFVAKLSDNDSTFLMSFSSDVYLNQDWTQDKSKLLRAIDALDTVPSKTALFKAIVAALDKMSQSKQSVRHLLVLSDGANTVPFYDHYHKDSIYLNDEILNVIKNKAVNIPIYIVALGFGENDSIGIKQIETIAKSTFGKVTYIYDKDRLDSLYENFKSSVNENACCEIYFNVDPCKTGDKKYIRLLFSPSDTLLLTKVISFNCDVCQKITSVEHGAIEIQSIDDINIFPNPTRSISQFEYSVYKSSHVRIRLVDIYGNLINEYIDYHETPGKYFKSIDLKDLPNGTYFLNLFVDNKLITKKVIILR